MHKPEGIKHDMSHLNYAKLFTTPVNQTFLALRTLFFSGTIFSQFNDEKVYHFDEQLVRSENLSVTYQPTGNLWRQEYDFFHSIIIV